MSVIVSEQLPLLAAAPNGIRKLRELVVELAMRGKLVPTNKIKWQRRSLEEIGAWGSGGTPLKTHPEYYNGDIPWLVIGDLNEGVVTDSATKITTAGLENSSAKLIPPGTVLIAMYGSIGKLGIAGIECATNQAIAHCQPTVSIISSEYLLVFLRSVRESLIGSGQGLAQQNISQKILKSTTIDLPPLDIQAAIVTKVDELMALCDRLEAQQADAESAHAQLAVTLLDSLTRASDRDDFAASWQRLFAHFHTLFTTESSVDALKQTLLQLAVMGKLVPQDPDDEPASELVERIQVRKLALLEEAGGRKQKALSDAFREPPYETPSSWEWQTVDSVLHVTGGVTLGRKLAGRKMSSKPYLRVANVQRGHLDLHQIKEVEVPEDEVEKYLLRDGDLLITEGGDWDKVGRTAIWRDELPECLHQNHVFRARAVTTEWEPRWAEMYLNAAPAREYFAGSSKQTTNLASINMTQLRACAFPVPPLAEQHRIVAKFDQLMSLCGKLCVAIQQRNQHSCHLADALVDKALSSAPETSADVIDLSCYLVSCLATKPTFGRTAHMKLIYLADTHVGLKLRGSYMREAAGPLDKSLYRVEEQAEASGWYTHTSAPLKSGKEKVTYHATSALAEKARKFAEELGGKRRKLDRLISMLGDRNTEELEIVATLFAVWNDALLDGQSPGDDWIIREVRENWHIEKQRFSPDQLRYWLNWMRDKRLVPSGTGRHTQHQARLL